MKHMTVVALALTALVSSVQAAPEVLRLDAPAMVETSQGLAAPTPALARLDFDRAWREAWERDPTLRAARSQSLVASERIAIARSQVLPQVQFSASYLENDIDRTQLNFLGRPVTTQERYASRNQTLSVRQPLYRPALLAAQDQAEQLAAQGQAQLQQQEQQLALRVMRAYLQTLLAQEQIRLIASQAQSIAAQVKAAELSLARGVGTRTDVDEARAQQDLNEAQRLQAEQLLQVSRRQLLALVGVEFGELAPLQVSKAQLELSLGRATEPWVARALESSPELQALRAQTEAARQEVRRLRAGHLPTLDAIAQLQKSTSENVNSPNSGYTNRAWGFQLQVPLYSGGAVSAQVRQAQHEVDRLRESVQALELDLGVRVHTALRGTTEGVSRVSALMTAERSAALALDSARRSFQAGVRSTLDVLDAEQRLVQVQLDLSRARHETMVAYVELHALTGLVDSGFVQRLAVAFNE